LIGLLLSPRIPSHAAWRRPLRRLRPGVDAGACSDRLLRRPDQRRLCRLVHRRIRRHCGMTDDRVGGSLHRRMHGTCGTIADGRYLSRTWTCFVSKWATCRGAPSGMLASAIFRGHTARLGRCCRTRAPQPTERAPVCRPTPMPFLYAAPARA
jgi:hypothetical protein